VETRLKSFLASRNLVSPTKSFLLLLLGGFAFFFIGQSAVKKFQSSPHLSTVYFTTYLMKSSAKSMLSSKSLKATSGPIIHPEFRQVSRRFEFSARERLSEGINLSQRHRESFPSS
jgi:hypothetical protein